MKSRPQTHRFFNPKQTSKYSDTFFKRILRNSFAALILSFSILLLFFLWNTINNRFEEEQKVLKATNTECCSVINEVLSQAKNISMFFSIYKDFSSLYQNESKIDVQKLMLEQEMSSFISCFNYLNGICVETRDSTIFQGISANAEYEAVACLDPFILYSTTPDTYPALLRLSFTSSDLDMYSVDVTLHSEYLCTHYMSENSYLLAENGTILLAKDYNLINQHILDVLSVDADSPYRDVISDDYLYADTAISMDGLSLVSVMPKSTVYTATIGQLLSTFLAFSIIMFLTVFLLFSALKHIYRPIKDVAQVLKYHMPNNDSMLESDADFIKNCMKRYATNEDIDAALLQIRKSQLQTLQAQISPHLLGNTLETIKWDLIALAGEDSRLVSSIGSLSMFLEESYEYQRMITTIGAEVERTRYYADMMAYCFYEALQFKWEISDGILDCAIINLTLQPFIENCINHAFNRLEEHPLVTIRIAEHDETIFIEIEDNGQGMDADTLSGIRQMLADDGPCEHHIGIKNSHLKLKLLFGDEYGITNIQSSPKGTYVRLEIPKRVLQV